MIGKRMAATLAAASLLVLAACTHGSGPVLDESREVGAFTAIDAGGGVQVHVTIGQAGPIVVHAQQNILDKLSTEVRSDGTLRIEALEDFVVADPVVIDVVTPQLAGISLSGGAAVQLSGLRADAIELSLSGGARATISGAVTDMTLGARGGATASLRGLTVETANVSIDGGATVEMTASQSVKGSASGGATLSVSGDASVQVEASGGAQVAHD